MLLGLSAASSGWQHAHGLSGSTRLGVSGGVTIADCTTDQSSPCAPPGPYLPLHPCIDCAAATYVHVSYINMCNMLVSRDRSTAFGLQPAGRLVSRDSATHLLPVPGVSAFRLTHLSISHHWSRSQHQCLAY